MAFSSMNDIPTLPIDTSPSKVLHVIVATHFRNKESFIVQTTYKQILDLLNTESEPYVFESVTNELMRNIPLLKDKHTDDKWMSNLSDDGLIYVTYLKRDYKIPITVYTNYSDVTSREVYKI